MSGFYTITYIVMAALGRERQRSDATQSACVRAPEESFISLDGRVRPGHDEGGVKA